jgi:alkanesulfonate monooxygenase SsuD/methylene tetrahydromethanopterin reductase-like flavin-dependent oxidoreductase (luciferase family)
VLVDLAINPFDAEVGDMVEVAELAEVLGVSAVWVTDHFSGSVVGRSWSRDPFVVLGAIAAVTERIHLGVLVANVVNRHPAQLACAVNSLQSIAPGRVRLGVGSGAAPGSPFAVEHEAIGRSLGDVDERRRLLVDSIDALRAVWSGKGSFPAPLVGFDGLRGVVDGAACPPIIVGASAWSTIEVAVERADGVNVRVTARTAEFLERIAPIRPPEFEVSVLDWLRNDERNATGLERAGCQRLILGVSAPFDRHELTDRVTAVQ